MKADSFTRYRPGNLLIGGGGRGVRVAPEGTAEVEWVVIRDKGNLVGEVLMKRSAFERLDPKKQAELRGTSPGDHERGEKQF
jgi:hypothetical protein